MKIWLIGSVFLFGLTRAPSFLVVGVLCGSRRCFLTPWLKLVVMRHGETIAMLLKDRAGGRRVSHISEPSRKRCFGTTFGPSGVHLCCFGSKIVSPMAPGCHGVHFGSSGGPQGSQNAAQETARTAKMES